MVPHHPNLKASERCPLTPTFLLTKMSLWHMFVLSSIHNFFHKFTVPSPVKCLYDYRCRIWVTTATNKNKRPHSSHTGHSRRPLQGKNHQNSVNEERHLFQMQRKVWRKWNSMQELQWSRRQSNLSPNRSYDWENTIALSGLSWKGEIDQYRMYDLPRQEGSSWEKVSWYPHW